MPIHLACCLIIKQVSYWWKSSSSVIFNWCRIIDIWFCVLLKYGLVYLLMFTRLVIDNINYKSLHLAVKKLFLLFSCGFQGGDYIIVLVKGVATCNIIIWCVKILLSGLWSVDCFSFKLLLICELMDVAVLCSHITGMKMTITLPWYFGLQRFTKMITFTGVYFPVKL